MRLLMTNALWRVLLGLLLFALFVAALPTAAEIIIVEDDCGLRDAIVAANTNKKVDGCKAGSGAADIIILTDHIERRRPLVTITSDITIEGRGRSVEFGDYPAFVITDGKLTLKNLNVLFKWLRTGDVAQITDGSLTLGNTIFHDCRGGITAEDSSIHFLDDSVICGHGRDVINAWFGVFPPDPHTCEALTGITVTASMGFHSGVNCQPVDAMGLGDKTLIDGGFLDAVDVWGSWSGDLDVCFHQLGATVFRDAANAPRISAWIDSWRSGDMTCARLPGAGTLVLMPGAPATVGPPPTTTAPTTQEAAPAVAAVDGCPIHTTGHLKLRAEPSLDGEILGYVVRGSTLAAISRTTFWYQVSYQGQTGWIGGLYVDNVGNC